MTEKAKCHEAARDTETGVRRVSLWTSRPRRDVVSGLKQLGMVRS